MKFHYMVKHNGIDYAAGEEVPIENTGGAAETPSETHVYTREEVELMSARKIREIADEIGIAITSTRKEDIVNEFIEKQK